MSETLDSILARGAKNPNNGNFIEDLHQWHKQSFHVKTVGKDSIYVDKFPDESSRYWEYQNATEEVKHRLREEALMRERLAKLERFDMPVRSANLEVTHFTIWPNKLCLMKEGKISKEKGFGAQKAKILRLIAKTNSSIGSAKIAESLDIKQNSVGREISDIRAQVFKRFGIPGEMFIPKILPRKGYRFGDKVRVTIGKK